MSAASTFFSIDAVSDIRKMLLSLIEDRKATAEQGSRQFEFNTSNVTIDFTNNSVTIEGVISACGIGPEIMTLDDFVMALKTEPMYPDGWVEVHKPIN